MADYVLEAQTAYFKLESQTPEERVKSCEAEIAAILEKYRCELIIQVAAK
jgi:hypothetical protein